MPSPGHLCSLQQGFTQHYENQDTVIGTRCSIGSNHLFLFPDGEKIPNCSLDEMRQSIKRDTAMEKIILSIPPMIKRFPLWLSYEHVKSSYKQVICAIQLINLVVYSNASQSIFFNSHLDLVLFIIHICITTLCIIAQIINCWQQRNEQKTNIYFLSYIVLSLIQRGLILR